MSTRTEIHFKLRIHNQSTQQYLQASSCDHCNHKSDKSAAELEVGARTAKRHSLRRNRRHHRRHPNEDLSTNLTTRVLRTVDIDIRFTRNDTFVKKVDGSTTCVIHNTGHVDEAREAHLRLIKSTDHRLSEIGNQRTVISNRTAVAVGTRTCESPKERTGFHLSRSS
jgi:hypothetical protein